MADTTRDEEQTAWFRTPDWQEGEAEATRDIAEGRVTRHESVAAMFAYLDNAA